MIVARNWRYSPPSGHDLGMQQPAGLQPGLNARAFNGVSDGSRTRDIQDHNLAL
jgi:hypothetical protein